jgi:hypothetical protein
MAGARIPILLSVALVALGLVFTACSVKETDPEAVCDDGEDNDLDGLYDCDDPDCAGVAGCPGGEDDDVADDDDAGDDDDVVDDDSADDDDVADDDSAGAADDDSAA